MTNYVSSFANGEAVDAELTKVLNSNLSATHKITRSTSLVVAANDSTAKAKAQADYVCDGTADNVEIQAAIDALPSTGGEIKLIEGTFQLAAILSRAIDNITIGGVGRSTYVKYNASNFVIDVGARTSWVIKDLRVDHGGIGLTTAKKWSIINVWRDGIGTVARESYVDNWSEEHIGGNSSNGSFLSEMYRHPLISLVDDFEGSDWTTVGAGQTLTWDTDIKHDGTQSAKIECSVAGPGQTVVIKKAITGDFTNSSIALWIRTPDYTTIDYLSIQFFTNGGLTNWAKYISYSIQPVNDTWFPVVLDTYGTGGGTPDLASVTEIRCTAYAKSGRQITIYFDRFVTWKKVLTPKGAVIFTFDDGFPATYELAKPIMDVYNYKGVDGVIPTRLTDDEIATLKTIQESGWDIVSHSFHHTTADMTANPSWEYIFAHKWLAEHGFKSGSRFSILYGGEFNIGIMNAIKDNILISRGGLSGYTSLPLTSYTQYIKSCNASDAVASILQIIDTVKTNKTLVQLMFHEVVASGATDYEYNVADFQTIVEYCNSQGVEVLTYSDMVDRIRSRNIITNGTGTIASEATSVNIRHGFSHTPTSIQITPTSALGSAASIWISDNDTGTGNLFTVSVNAAPGADVTFNWVARL